MLPIQTECLIQEGILTDSDEGHGFQGPDEDRGKGHQEQHAQPGLLHWNIRDKQAQNVWEFEVDEGVEQELEELFHEVLGEDYELNGEGEVWAY